MCLRFHAFSIFSVFYENDEYYCAPSELMSKEEGAVALLTRTKVSFNSYLQSSISYFKKFLHLLCWQSVQLKCQTRTEQF